MPFSETFMTIPFRKMNGLGNDFVVIDQRETDHQLQPAQYMKIANRENGIGCDQIILLEKADQPADVTMRIVNADGGEVESCGNATRCIAALVMAETGKDQAVIDTIGGRLVARPAKQEGWISVDMGEPKFGWEDIPLSEEFYDTTRIELQVGPIDAPILHTPSVVNVGNPHAVFWVKQDVNSYELDRFGPMLEFHPLFPESANISIAQVVADDYIIARVWERGAGLTLACGTGACAIGVAAARKRLARRDVTVRLPGGELHIHWTDNNRIIMSGAWAQDFTGTLPDHVLS